LKAKENYVHLGIESNWGFVRALLVQKIMTDKIALNFAKVLFEMLLS
jgi:hypothetical protein